MCLTIMIVVMIVWLAAFILAVEYMVVSGVEVLMLAPMVATTVSSIWVILLPVPPLPRVLYPCLCCWWWALSVRLGCVGHVLVVCFPY